MNTTHKAAAITAAALLATTLAATAADAAGTVTIRPGDLNTAETRTSGHVDFLRDGLHVYTTDNTSLAKAAGYFPLTGGIPASASTTWVGTQPQPGQQFVFDADGITGNGNDYNILVGEPVYGADWWLTPSSSADAKAAAPVNGGGSGSTWHGTLADWSTALPGARALAGGFSLGSGVLGDGVIERMQYGTTVYEFTSTPVSEDGTDGEDGATGPVGPQGPAGPHTTAHEPLTGIDPANLRVDVTGHLTPNVKARRVVLRFITDALPAGTVQGKALTWRVKVDGKFAAKITQGDAERDRYAAKFTTGKHRVKVTNSSGAAARFVLSVK